MITKDKLITIEKVERTDWRDVDEENRREKMKKSMKKVGKKGVEEKR